MWRVSSVVAVRGLSCPEACGILVPQPGIEPASLALQGRFFTTGPPEESRIVGFRFDHIDVSGKLDRGSTILIEIILTRL